MESFSLSISKIVFLFIFLINYQFSIAQQILNYDNLSTSNKIIKSRIDKVLSSNEIIYDNSISRTSHNPKEILDLKYENLNLINQLNSSSQNNIKFCVLRIKDFINPINLNYLNSLNNLELIHLIIEVNYSSPPTVVYLNNQNIIISYQISVPQ